MQALTHVAIVSVGRSGSTLLMKALAAAPDSVFYFEPYYAYEVVDTRMKEVVVHTSEVPTIKELLNCDVLNNTVTTSRIISRFACNESRWLAETQTDIDACINRGSVNLHRARSRCMSAENVVVKILNLPWLSRKLGTTSLIPAGTKILHLVRHPAAVLKSQHAAGWDGFLLPHERLPGRSVLHQLASKICSEMIQNGAILDSHVDQSAVRIVRYEDLTANFSSAMGGVVEFVGLESSRALTEAIAEARATKHADLPSFAETSITLSDAERAVSEVGVCRAAVGRFYPLPNKSSYMAMSI